MSLRPQKIRRIFGGALRVKPATFSSAEFPVPYASNVETSKQNTLKATFYDTGYHKPRQPCWHKFFYKRTKIIHTFGRQKVGKNLPGNSGYSTRLM